MRTLFKWALRLVLAVVLLVAALLVFKNAILRSVAESRIRAETGMDARIGRFEVALLSPTITLQDLRLYNTAEFGGSTFLHIAEMHVEYDRPALALGRFHILLMRFNLAEINVVRNREDRMNVDTLLRQQQGRQPVSITNAPGTGGRRLEFTGIDTLNLTLGTARYTDLKQPRNNRETALGLRDRVINNVRSEQDLYGVLFELMIRHGAGFISQPLTSSLLDPLPALPFKRDRDGGAAQSARQPIRSSP